MATDSITGKNILLILYRLNEAVGIANLIVYFLQGNNGSGSRPNEDIKVFKKHRVSDHLYTVLLSMVPSKRRQ